MRLIDADALRADCDIYNSWDAQIVKAWLDDRPTIEIPHWIPCSERLPQDYQDVLVWFEYYRYGDYNRMYSTHGIGTYIQQYDSWWVNHESGWKDLRVFAWMPLPEPYEEVDA